VDNLFPHGPKVGHLPSITSIRPAVYQLNFKVGMVDHWPVMLESDGQFPRLAAHAAVAYSLREFRAGRSILLEREGRVVAGTRPQRMRRKLLRYGLRLDPHYSTK